MTKFSNYFGLPYNQAQLDFFDCNPTEDRPLYVDPLAISKLTDRWGLRCNEYIDSFFESLLDAVKNGDVARKTALTSHFGEPGDTYIGVSSGVPQGKGVGARQARQIVSAIEQSKAAQTGVLSDLYEIPLFIENIGRDKISDLTTNIIRDVLYEYTEQQCILHGVPMEQMAAPHHWNIVQEEWETDFRMRPVIAGNPILLIPKRLLRHTVILTGRSFYNSGMTDFLKADELQQMTPLVQYRKKTKLPYVTKASIKNKYKFSKDAVAEFVDQNGAFYKDYISKVDDGTPIDIEFICTDTGAVKHFNSQAFAKTLAENLQKIPKGKNHAEEYHKFMLGCLTFLLYPSLTNPKKEQRKNQGRKRIDIMFDNTAIRGIFRRVGKNAKLNSVHVPVECKNYSKDIANAEFDQLLGRFDPYSGKFGILTCRKDDKAKTTLARCKDALHADQGLVLVLTDDDIINMLENFESGQRLGHLEVLEKKYRAVMF